MAVTPIKKASVVDSIKSKEPKDRIYVLLSDSKPLTYTLANRHKDGTELQYFDKKSNTLKALRYATNQESVFIKEQTGDVTLGDIVFEKGVLVVPSTNPTLQLFLELHPRLNHVYELFDPEAEAEKHLEDLDLEYEASKVVRELKMSELENIALAIYGAKATTMSSSEIKRDLRIFARDYPEHLLKLATDDMISLRGWAVKAVSEGILIHENHRFLNGKDVVLIVPHNSDDDFDDLARYFKTKEGELLLRFIKTKLD